jgi:arylsulfatase A-like enzyme
MVAHDEHIGRMLAKLDELGIADDTIVIYSTENGPHYNSWPDGAITPFRSEKNTNCPASCSRTCDGPGCLDDFRGAKADLASTSI